MAVPIAPSSTSMRSASNASSICVRSFLSCIFKISVFTHVLSKYRRVLIGYAHQLGYSDAERFKSHAIFGSKSEAHADVFLIVNEECRKRFIIRFKQPQQRLLDIDGARHAEIAISFFGVCR